MSPRVHFCKDSHQSAIIHLDSRKLSKVGWRRVQRLLQTPPRRIQMDSHTTPRNSTPVRGYHFCFGTGVSINKIATSLISVKEILQFPHHWYILPLNRLKLYWYQPLNKINTLSMVILWLPTFWSSTILWTPLKKKIRPSHWNPHFKENESPYYCLFLPLFPTEHIKFIGK